MNRTILSVLALLCCMAAPTCVDAQQMVYVLRHGEKLDEGKDPVLSPAGEARAVKLAQMLGSAGVKSIYTTQYRRTSMLAAPLAKALNIAPVVHPAGDTAGLVRKIKSHGADEIVLVIGHSNTVPEVLKGLGHSGEIRIDESEFDNLFVLVPRPPGAPALVQLKY